MSAYGIGADVAVAKTVDGGKEDVAVANTNVPATLVKWIPVRR